MEFHEEDIEVLQYLYDHHTASLHKCLKYNYKHEHMNNIY
jgi:hypothetical protein